MGEGKGCWEGPAGVQGKVMGVVSRHDHNRTRLRTPEI